MCLRTSRSLIQHWITVTKTKCDNENNTVCREAFQLPEYGGVLDLPEPVPDIEDSSDDEELGSFEIVSDVCINNQPTSEQTETSDIQTDNAWPDHSVSDVTDDVINRNVGISSTSSEGSLQQQPLDNEVRMNSPVEQLENEPGIYLLQFFTTRCYAERGYATVYCLSVRIYRDHIGWNSSKIISWLISSSEPQHRRSDSTGTLPTLWVGVGVRIFHRLLIF